MTQDECSETWEAGFRAGFYAGFRATGEGWNAEYPFEGVPLETDEAINASLEQALQGEMK